MTSGGNNVNYFSDNKPTKLTNLVQFKRLLIFYLPSCGLGPLDPPLSICHWYALLDEMQIVHTWWLTPSTVGYSSDSCASCWIRKNFRVRSPCRLSGFSDKAIWYDGLFRNVVAAASIGCPLTLLLYLPKAEVMQGLSVCLSAYGLGNSKKLIFCGIGG